MLLIYCYILLIYDSSEIASGWQLNLNTFLYMKQYLGTHELSGKCCSSINRRTCLQRIPCNEMIQW
jgi:hypothetical protein